MKIRSVLVPVLAGALILVVGIISLADKDEPLKEGLKHFEKHNYKDALVLLRKALEGEVEDRGDVGMKVLVCLGKLKKWDEAVKEAGPFIEEHKGTVWAARGHQTRGALLFEQPHYGYRTKDGKFKRGRYVRGGYYVGTEKGDFEKSCADMEEARLLMHALLAKAEAGTDESKSLRAETVQVDMDLARVLEGMANQWMFRNLLEEKKEDQARVAAPPYSRRGGVIG
ncbi:MAG: hypothetical protein ACYTFG_10335 [Planctomycetota bacterium]|jgi:hypothetical protein